MLQGGEARAAQALAREIIDDLTEGVDGSGIKAGIIGEIGCSWPPTTNERKSLSAAAIAQQETGAAISIHPRRRQDAPSEIGADNSRVIMGHLDRTVFDVDTLLRIAESDATWSGICSAMKARTIRKPISIYPAMLSGLRSSDA